MCVERVDGGGSGATEYILSMGNQNAEFSNKNMPDNEGSPRDGSESDFHPQSVGPNRPGF